jgi:hypothetical protein
LSAEYPSDEIEAEKTYKTPVYGADDGKSQCGFIHFLNLLFKYLSAKTTKYVILLSVREKNAEGQALFAPGSAFREERYSSYG